MKRERTRVFLLASTEDLLDSGIMSLKVAWYFMFCGHVQLHGCRPVGVDSWMLQGVGFLPGKCEEEARKEEVTKGRDCDLLQNLSSIKKGVRK